MWSQRNALDIWTKEVGFAIRKQQPKRISNGSFIRPKRFCRYFILMLNATCQTLKLSKLDVAHKSSYTCIIFSPAQPPKNNQGPFRLCSQNKEKTKRMAKKMVHVGGGGGGGIGKKRLIKRSKKKYIHKVIDYLLSDCYLFAPLLISPSPINNSHVTPTRGFFHFSSS